MAEKITDFFPLETPRKSQLLVLDEIQKAYTLGYKYVILEAPVGSGKSAIAITAARWVGDAHVLTPRRALQNQYYDDFSDHAVLMKGRSSYPCTFGATASAYKKIIIQIEKGFIAQPDRNDDNCSNAPCTNSTTIFKLCTDQRECPYHAAIDVANKSETIIHNLHSFIFQVHFAGRFDKRKLLIIDEAHEVEGIVREFSSKTITIKKALPKEAWPAFKTLPEWGQWLGKDEFVNQFSDTPTKIKDQESERDVYRQRIVTLEENAENWGEKFVASPKVDLLRKTTSFTFIPEAIGSTTNNLLFQLGEKVLLMSGTVYSKEQFCRNLGINEEAAYFIRIGTSFPIESRPIIVKPEYLVDTSHKMWDVNFKEMIEKITLLLNKFPDVKGLIHAPSYLASTQISLALRNNRIMGHEPDNFQSRLEEFYSSKDPRVFISPTCQQGVDFKDDRGRFQIILRVPYSNTSDPFTEYKVKNNYPWYNYQALVVFGQQIGRINRSENDFGVTILMDSRFETFLRKNNKVLPKWLTDSIKRN